MMNAENILNALNAGVLAVSSDTKELFINQKACDLLRLEKNVPGARAEERIKELSGLSFADMKAVLLKSVHGKRCAFFSPEDADGDRKNYPPLSFTYHLSQDTKSGPPCLVILVGDAGGALQARAMKKEFVALAYHDIRTPISSIKESSSLVADGTLGELSEMQKKCMDIALKELAKAQRILENIIRIGQFSEFALFSDDTREGLESCVKYALMLTREKCNRQKITLKQDFSPEDVSFVLANHILLNESFYYIADFVFENAARSSEVALSRRKENGSVVFEFRYSGSSPSGEEWNTIFSDFWARKETALIRKKYIDAFSLRIAHSIIQNYGGKLEVLVRKETGTASFLVSFPAE